MSTLKLLLLFSPLFFFPAKNNVKVSDQHTSTTETVKNEKISEALLFCKNNKLDTSFACFVDMSLHSGKKRFFVIDLHSGKTIKSALCCHGWGKNSTETNPVFSNLYGSECTSLGKYKTGKRAYSNWGINVHYKMHGLEKTNNNAFKRMVVLHSYDPVPETEIYPQHLPLGWSKGCPVISNDIMTYLDNYLQKTKRPLLIWIY